MKIFRCLTLATLVFCFSSPALAQNHQSDTPLVFKSRKAVQKKLGAEIADQIPESFNFGIHALVWPGLEYADGATVKVETLPAVADEQLRQHSPGIWFTIQRLPTEVAIELRLDSPCSGGMAKSQEMLQQCAESVKAGAIAAKKVITLFATPRAKLKRAKLTKRRMPPRP